MRGGPQSNTLLGSSLVDGRMSAATNHYGNVMVKSNSGASIGAADDKLQRS